MLDHILLEDEFLPGKHDNINRRLYNRILHNSHFDEIWHNASYSSMRYGDGEIDVLIRRDRTAHIWEVKSTPTNKAIKKAIAQLDRAENMLKYETPINHVLKYFVHGFPKKRNEYKVIPYQQL